MCGLYNYILKMTLPFSCICVGVYIAIYYFKLFCSHVCELDKFYPLHVAHRRNDIHFHTSMSSKLVNTF